MTAGRLMAQSLIDAGDNLVILAPVWPNIAAVVTMRTLLIAQPRIREGSSSNQGTWA